MMMPRRKNFRVGQGGFVVPPQGRPPIGGLPGESKEDRDKRVLAYIQAHPKMDADAIARVLGVPKGVVRKYAHHAKLMVREAVERLTAPAQFKPNPLFTPGPPPLPTPEERLAAVSDDVKAGIAARYGATFKT